jgi:lipopolysaccharide biosynthesis regulator YciM
MELGLLFLLLPVAAFSGWWYARRSMGQEQASPRVGLNSDYFTGLNYLLNEQPDKAVDVFIKMLEVDSDTVETHLALGNLFRRRGEGDRAIRIHQNLIARPTLTKEQRAQALFELGKDYMRVGFLDRAENLFLELADDRNYKHLALDNLLDIYQQEKDWEKAITTARSIESSTGKRMNALIAQFCCELAEIAKANGENKLALKMLKRALVNDKQCVRANLLIGDIERETNNCKAAIKAYRQVEQQDTQYLTEVIEPLFECYQATGRVVEMEEFLAHLNQNHGGAASTLALAEVARIKEGEAAAKQTIIQALKKKPTVAGLVRLIELDMANSESAAKQNLATLKDVALELMESHPGYQCKNCGFVAKTLHWQCPTCRRWCTIKPIQAEEIE